MLICILLLIGFFIEYGTLGENIINAFSLAQYGLWFIFVFVSIFGVSLISYMLFSKNKKILIRYNRKFRNITDLGSITTTKIILSLICIFDIGISYLQLHLSYYIIENVSPLVQSFSEISNNVQYSIFTFLFIITSMILNMGNKN